MATQSVDELIRENERLQRRLEDEESVVRALRAGAVDTRHEELLRIQNALRASEERYRLLFDSIDEGFCVIEMLFDENGQPCDYQFWETNPSFEQQTGLRGVVGKTMRELAPQHEQHWFDTYGQVALTGEPIRFQNYAQALHRWYDVYAFRVGDPQEQKVAVLFNNFTERKRTEDALQASEARLRLILDNTPAFVYVVDDQNCFVFINKRWNDPFGLTNEVAAGRSIYDFFPRETADQFAANNRKVLETGCPLETEETVSHADGQRTYITCKVPLLDSAGVPYAVCGISVDISERKQAVEALREADRNKDEFLATLAHELRNPLAPIRNALQILQTEGPPVPELQWALGVIDRQLQTMSRLLEDLLDVSRISRKNLVLRKGQVDLREVLDAAVETSRPVIEAACHELTISLPPAPVTLQADKVRLAEVFANLLNNAAKYTEEGGRIRLSAERQGSDVVVSVQDSGIGIAAEMLPRVFDIFSQAKPALGRSQGGLGIGLSLAQGMVNLHGGTITVHSKGVGQGSEFIVRLPVANDAVSSQTAPRRKTERPRSTVRRSIVIADDNRDSADSLAMLLKLLGHDVRVAYDGEQAVRAVEAAMPDLVLLDLGMPQLDGCAACRHIRAQPWGREVFVIALTGWGQEEDRRRTQEAGFDHHMVKPVDPDALTKLLATLPEKNAGSQEPPDDA